MTATSETAPAGPYDPIPGAPHGRCSTCGADLATREDTNEHLRANLGADPGHSVQVKNPDRVERIRTRVTSIIDDAVDKACGEFDRMGSREDVTEEEIRIALRWYPDFEDGWADWQGED